MIDNVTATNDMIVNKGEGYTPSPPPSPSTTQKSSSGPAVEVELTKEIAETLANSANTSEKSVSTQETKDTLKKTETTNPGQNTDIDTEKRLKETIDSLNDKLTRMDREVLFKLDKRINKNYISVIDKKSKEIIREFPPEEIRTFIAKFDEINAKLSNSTDVKSLLVNLEV